MRMRFFRRAAWSCGHALLAMSSLIDSANGMKRVSNITSPCCARHISRYEWSPAAGDGLISYGSHQRRLARRSGTGNAASCCLHDNVAEDTAMKCGQLRWRANCSRYCCGSMFEERLEYVLRQALSRMCAGATVVWRTRNAMNFHRRSIAHQCYQCKWASMRKRNKRCSAGCLVKALSRMSFTSRKC